MVGTEVGGYRVVEKLGSGGMGVVYLAEHAVLGRSAVVKVLRAKHCNDEEVAKRFINEAKAAAAIDHPGIVNVMDVGRLDDGRLYILMEHLLGESLRGRLDRQRRLSENQALAIVRQAAGALRAAHRLGIVHRDLKPDNMFLVPDPEVRGGERVKLLDFGIAKLNEDIATEEVKTHTGAIMGTPYYMSPEQCGDSANVDARTDLYALGCILFELLCGRPPFVAKTGGEIVAAHLRDEPPSTSSLVSVSDQVDALVTALLAKEPDKRLAKASDLVREIDRIDSFGGEGGPPSGNETLASDPGSTRTLAPRRAPGTAGTADSAAGSSTLGAAAAQALTPAPLPSPHRRWVVVTGLGGAALVATLALAVPRLVADSTDPHAQSGLSSKTAAETPTVVRMTRGDGRFMYPSLSPGGRRVVYTDMTDILLRRVKGSKITNLTADFAPRAVEPAFSPDGESIAFSAGGDLYVMGAGSENIRRVTQGGYWPKWSPDGKQLVFTTLDTYDIYARPERGSELWRVAVASGDRTKLAGSEEDPRQPSWSPDGRRIAFVGASGIVTVAPDGSDLTAVGIDNAWHPVWDHESRGLYMLRDNKGSYEIFWSAVDATTGQARDQPRQVLPVGTTTLWQFDVANQGKRIVGSVYQTEYAVFRIDFDRRKRTALSLPKALAARGKRLKSPSVSADGKQIVYASWQVNEDLYASDADGNGLHKLTNAFSTRRAPQFSPKGDRIAWHGGGSDGWGIWAIDPDGSDLRRLSPLGTGYLRRPHWSPDGSHLAVATSNKRGPFSPVIINLALPWASQITAQRSDDLLGWTVGPWSPKGKWLALSSPKGIARLHVGTRKIEPLLSSGSDVAWLSETELIVADEQRLVLLNAKTRRTRELVSLSPWRATIHPSLALSPDHKTIYMGARLEEAILHVADLVEDARPLR